MAPQYRFPSKPLNAPQAMCFDMDGLLIDSEALALEQWSKAAEDLGHPIPRELMVKAIGRSDQQTKELFLSILGPDYPYDRVLDLRFDYTKTYYASREVPVKPGVQTLLDWAQSRGITLGVATSTQNPYAAAKLESSGLSGYFARIVTGDQVRHNKPDPEIYLTLCRRLGVSPGDALGLEDSQSGLLAAQAAGLGVIHIPDLGPVESWVRDRCLAVLPRPDALIPYISEA